MGAEGMSSIVMIVVMIVIFYFMLIRPENKRKKKAEEMRNAIKKGDTVTTIGGIIGRVVHTTPNTLVIETSEDRVRIEIAKWAVSTNGVQTSKQPVEEKASKKSKKEEAAPVAEEKVEEKAE